MKKGVDYIGVGCGAIIFDHDGLVLLTKRGPLAKNEAGKWDFPGGAVEFNETCEDAVKREIREELDIDVEILELLEVTDHIIPEEHQHWVSPSYSAKYASGELRIMEPGKIDKVKWVALADIDKDSLTLSSKSTLEAYIKKCGSQPLSNSKG